jgi:hypothetical protein
VIGRDNRVGPHPALTARDVRRMLAMIEAGGCRVDIAEALGVAVRTVHRYKGASIESVIVGSWRLTFLLRRDYPPALLERLHIR